MIKRSIAKKIEWDQQANTCLAKARKMITNSKSSIEKSKFWWGLRAWSRRREALFWYFGIFL